MLWYMTQTQAMTAEKKPSIDSVLHGFDQDVVCEFVVCFSGAGLSSSLTEPQPQGHQDVEDNGLEEEQPEAQDGQRHEVHLRIWLQRVLALSFFRL